MVITVSKSFQTANGQAGVMATDLGIDYLADLVSETSVGEGAYAFLIDDQGSIVTHLDKEFIPNIEKGYKNINEILDGKFSRILDNENISDKDRKIKDYDGVERLFFFGDDETGQMYNSFQSVIDKLKIFMEELQTSVHTNHRVYEETMDRLGYLIAQAEDTSATTEELSAGMEETSASVIAINESAREIDNTISDFAEKVEEGAHTSNEISTNADMLSNQFIRAKDNTMETYIKAREEIQAAITSSREVAKVNILSSTILEISKQTSLLSLNASIEAARAGEYGQGFAVGQYKNDGHSLNMIIADLSATSEELAATVTEISISMREISSTVGESTKATVNIAEKNMNVVDAIHDINSIMEGNKEVSEKLEEIVSQVEY